MILTTVLVPAASYLLTDLPTVKDELQIGDSSQDATLTRMLAEVCDDIHQYCNRVFPIETVQDTIYPDRDAYPYQVPGGLVPLRLSRWPLVPFGPVLTTSGATTSGAVLPFASTAGVAVGQPASGQNIPLGALVTAIAPDVSVTLSTPISALVPLATTVNFGPLVTVGDPPAVPTTLSQGSNFIADLESGLLTRLSLYTTYPTTWDAITTTIVYQAGYSTIPNNLVGAALRVLTARYKARGRDPRLKSQDQPQLGTQNYWIGNMPGVRGAFPEEIADVLNRYRVPVVG